MCMALYTVLSSKLVYVYVCVPLLLWHYKVEIDLPFQYHCKTLNLALHIDQYENIIL